MDHVIETEAKIEESNRLSIYKRPSFQSDQETRRLELLQTQKKNRGDAVNRFRNINDLFSDLEKEEEYSDDTELQDVEFMVSTNSKPKFQRMEDMFMLSEWMTAVPENLFENWLFVLCPVGKRCLVRCAKGCTKVYGKKGRIAQFQSLLPNGCHKDYINQRYSNSDVTILDCIWNRDTKSYFVLDLLSWKGQFYMDTEASFRCFWTKSKIQEMEQLSQRSEKNPFPFFPLEYYPCNIDTFYTVLNSHPYFPSDNPNVDGILFYHSESFYTNGTTPLVVWLKPFMISEILGIEISEAYMEAKPSSYSNMMNYIKEFEETQKLKANKTRRKQRRQLLEEIEMVDSVNSSDKLK